MNNKTKMLLTSSAAGLLAALLAATAAASSGRRVLIGVPFNKISENLVQHIIIPHPIGFCKIIM